MRSRWKAWTGDMADSHTFGGLLFGVGTVGAVRVGATSEAGLQLPHLRISNVQRSRLPLGLELICSCSLAPTHLTGKQKERRVTFGPTQ